METLDQRNQINIEDEMRRSYLDYAMSVIIGRALPDVRDGFKPVHRRVLWAMHELGNAYNKPYKKSARIVGDCFVKGTLVHTEHGLKPIEEIEAGERVQLPTGYLSEVVQSFHNPPAPVLDVTLSNGLTLTVTPGQLFRVLNDDLTVGWERADRLAGRRVLVSSPRALGDAGEHTDGARRAAAYSVGLLVAEGYLTDRGRSRRVGIQMADREPLAFVAEFCASQGVAVARHERAPQKPHHRRQYGLRFSWLGAASEASAPTSALKEVPSWVLADRRLYAPFLAGYADGDGYLRTGGSRREAVLVSTSDRLIGQLQAMLADGGIHASRAYEDFSRRAYGANRLPHHTLTLTGENAARFARLIAPHLRVTRKRAAAFAVSGPRRRVLNTTTESLPAAPIFAELSARHLGGGWYSDVKGDRFRAGIKYPTGSKLRHASDPRGKNISYRQLESLGILSKLDRIGSPLAARLRTLTETYCVLSVTEVTDRGALAETYDIQIADAGHEFLAHGVAVHNCIGKYHPHGDTAVYDTIVRMAQDFSLRYPLVDGQGNFGSVDGDAAAAMRYTEARMARIATEVLADIEKETVPFQPNYDESLSEPSVLPTRVPNLLLNGADGIAVGMATKIPPHNLSEIVDATVALIKKPNLKDAELLAVVPGPDFPTGGFIYGREGIRQAYTTGRGIIQMRARAGIDRIGRGNTERDAIIITEIPYQVNKARLIERIAELVNEKKLEGVADLRDESSRDGMRIVVELKRDAVPQIVLNKLYKLTPMQSTFGVINLAIVGGQPRVLTLRQMLEHFVEFRREVVRRRTEYDLRKARARAHILEGLNRAIDALDYIIPLIRNARSADEAKAWLTGRPETMTEVRQWKGTPADLTLAGFIDKLKKVLRRLDFSEQQAQAILDLQLRRLSALERQKIIDEYEGVIKLIAELEDILANEASLRRVLVRELEDVKKNFGDARRTQIIDEGVELSIEDMIADEDVAITVTKSGYVKRTAVSTYQRQGRGGKGRSGAGTGKNEDWVEHLFIASTHSYLMIFTDDGQVYKLKVHEIPDALPSARGKAVVNLINIPSSRKLAGVIPVREFSEGRYVVMVTKKGVIKKTELSEFRNIRSNGINAVNVDDGDELLDVVLTDGTKRIFIATHDGMAIRFDESDVRPMGRTARGVRGVDLRKGDYVVSVAAVSSDDTERMLSVSECGYGKQTPITTYRLQSRGGKGVINMKTTDKTGKVVAVFPVDEESEVMIITKSGKLIRIEAGDIRKTGRSAQGVRLMKTDGSDKVTSASLLDPATQQEEVGTGA